MQIGPIVRALLRNKTGTALLVLQIAMTLAVLMNAVALMLRSGELVSLETGVAQENLVVFNLTGFSDAYNESSFRKARLEEDLIILGEIDGVQSATISNGAPSLHTWSDGMRLPDTETKGIGNFIHHLNLFAN